ncbi:hypothetical protein DPMN_038202 [Dreissena polymorpha]|uniref:CN hydrolase domain-containing protein n=2 Tax=Dreissena polymorpha TaxID=45954 RepID=A0A9D4MEZ4_DREPO|nr:hypothetical protein DPMN_038202 [Dreissena polymorpha]
MENIPEPERNWNPCEHPDVYPETEIQFALSCMARENNIYVVANIGDKQPCNVSLDPSCPRTGYYQYNTNVAYDAMGTLVAKYHKYNLFYENWFDKPSKVDISVFNTPFGRFGLIICFDILFEHPPIDLICRNNISNIAFPTAWMDAHPFYTSIQFHSAFAVGLGVNFLAANIHYPSLRFHGSGIYTQQGAAGYCFNTSNESGGQLIVQKIPVVDQSRLDACRGLNISLSDLNDQMLELDKTVNNGRETLQHTKRKGWGKGREKGRGNGQGQGKMHGHGQRNGQGQGKRKETRQEKGRGKRKGQGNGQGKGKGPRKLDLLSQPKFHKDMFPYDLYKNPFNLVPLRPEGRKTIVCHTDLCCHLSFSFEPTDRRSAEKPTRKSHAPDDFQASQHSTDLRNFTENRKDQDDIRAHLADNQRSSVEDFYAIGAYDGRYKNRSTGYYIQVCIVLRCRKQQNVVNCSASMAEDFRIRLSHFRLVGNFSATFQYPSILLQGESDFRLTEHSRRWSFSNGQLVANERFSSPLAVATIFARDYGRD